MKRIIYLCFLMCVIFYSCKKKDVTPAPKLPTPYKANFTSTQPRNLNVVYFVPSDLDTLKDYQRRLSELLLYDQNWYKKEMNRNGYGNKTFGLLADSIIKRVKIITIRGNLPKSGYPYNGGSGPMQQEIDTYFASHPSDKTSDHTLILIPDYSVDASGEPNNGGGPFYGIGRSCFALDYADFDIKYLGQTNLLGKRLTKWFGGMTHELGHGLNLPHNHAKVSEVATLGTTLMSSGNYTFGQSPTFLSSADCARLNKDEVFNTDTKTYYGTVNAGIKSIHANYDAAKGAIIVSGKFTTDTPVTDMIYYNDPNINNADYYAIAWTSKPMAVDSFYVEEKISDLEHKEDNVPYTLRVDLVHNNGVVTETDYSYTFLAGVPILKFSTRNEISKLGWTIFSVSSEETSAEPAPNGPVTNVIDGNPATYWHSSYSTNATVYPHQFVVDMGSVKKAYGLSINQRSGLSRAIKDAELWYSTDGISFTKINSYTLGNTNGPQYFDFASPLSFRYFKFIAKSAWDGQQFAALGEIGLY
jgi:hypothetical protein